MRRWDRQESGEVGRCEVPGFIQEWGTQGESKILSFCLMLIKRKKGWSDVNQGNEGDGLKIFLCAHPSEMERHFLNLL